MIISQVAKQRIPALDFATEKASSGRYGIHDYPAMLHYLVVRTLLNKYGGKKHILYDPFCGSGVSLCEGLRKGMVAFGTDINPLALLIASVRCSNNIKEVPTRKLMNEVKDVAPDVPEVKNIEYWFKDYVIEDLGRLRATIKKYSEEQYYELLLVAFSQTVRDVSNNRKGEFKRFRLSEDKLETFCPQVLAVFEKNLTSYIDKTIEDSIPEGRKYIFRSDVRKGIPFSKKVDMVITSPPYGDSRTTVAYGQFSSFSLDWLKGLNPFGDADLTLDTYSLGGKRVEYKVDFSKTLEKVYRKLARLNPKRANDVKAFYIDLFTACKNIVDILNNKAIVCFVVGNRTVNNLQIPMDEIVKEIFECLGLRHKETLIREIYNKRMPLQNSPTNITGKKASTMKHEYIVVMEKRNSDKS